MTVLDEMPRYKSQGEVRALKIQSIVTKDDERFYLVPADKRFKPIPVSRNFFERHRVKPTDYIVNYGGFVSTSPAWAFEEGWALIAPPNAEGGEPQ